MKTERECPECGEYTEMDSDAKTFQCNGCSQEWRINYDGEFLEGRWIDQTTLTPI